MMMPITKPITPITSMNAKTTGPKRIAARNISAGLRYGSQYSATNSWTLPISSPNLSLNASIAGAMFVS